MSKFIVNPMKIKFKNIPNGGRIIVYWFSTFTYIHQGNFNGNMWIVLSWCQKSNPIEKRNMGLLQDT